MSLKDYSFYMKKCHEQTPNKLQDVMRCFSDSPYYWDLLKFKDIHITPPQMNYSGQIWSSCWKGLDNMTEYEQLLYYYLLYPYDANYDVDPVQPSYAFWANWFPFYVAPVNPLQSFIYDNFKDRKILDKYIADFDIWEGTEDDYNYIHAIISHDVQNCIIKNRYKWGNLMKSTALDFNPLWNVDGVDEIVRTLERDGTESRAKTGTETDAKTGTETNSKTGTERDAKTGTETTTRTGTETTGYNGRELNTLSGSDSTTQTGTITHGTQKTTTESNTFLDTEKVTDTFNTPTTTLYGKSDQKSFMDRSDTLTLNTTDTLTHDTTDTITHGTTDTLTHATTDTLTHNTNDVLTLDTVDTERTRHERHGNIGVTTTTKLLEEFREYVNFSIMDIVAHDIVNTITEGVY